ncbi:M20/M25/M40 family metallo-hydrolase [Oecophyllibacter saccharovorans]|uniref:M20/M25/M40 family metallo-hydrolase n=1 Tax=Oecophyllibacter saccharovorans TaxID=2558360 RepID=UPI001172596D|nr:M20/M25/M40 family metallo-hydrolase [Oecophyllibacter saccharovorans]TPW34676.1 M20/M25/M40 family metallo-hydrolase [Oecophyllibacter saccharovorans]
MTHSTAPHDTEAVQAVLTEVDRSFDQALERLFALLRIPSVSTQPDHAADCRRAAQWLCEDMGQSGLTADIRDVNWAPPGNPMVVGRSPDLKKADGQLARRVLFYGHYDVQPTDPDNLWYSAPFEPHIVTEPDGRRVIVARGASDDKGQVMTFLEACRAWKKVHGTLPVAVTVLLEGEEECGGENLLPFMKDNAGTLQADLALICDTAMAGRQIPAITTRLRGMVAEGVEITCATQDLHSGIYGNAAANPIALLCRALADLRDGEGRVTLPGFYDGVKIPDDQTRAQWRSLYPDDAALLKEVGLSEAQGEKGFTALEQTWCRPSCEINGISGGYEGEGIKTVLPARAQAKVSFRLVPGQSPEKIRAAFRDHMRRYLPSDAEIRFTSYGGSPGYEVTGEGSADLTVALTALEEEWGNKALTIGCGGSIPVANEVKEALGLDALLVGFAQADDRMHSPNEQYGLDSFRHGIRSWVRLLAALA